MKKICFITTVSITIKAFILSTARYIHENSDWDISFICSYDTDFSQNLPDYIHFYPVQMDRGISAKCIKAIFEMKRIFEREKFDIM